MYTFKKQEKICSKKLIDALYLNGQSFMNYPFRVSYLKQQINNEYPAQVLFIVSKKRYKRAHDRNRIKRLMRESYRLLKNELYKYLNDKNINLVFSINYVATEELKFEFIKKNMHAALQKIISQQEPRIANANE